MEVEDEAAEDEMEVRVSDLEPLPRERSNTWHGSRAFFEDHQPKFAAISEKSSSFNSNEEEEDYGGHPEVKPSLEGHQMNNDASDHLSTSPAASSGRRNSVRRNAWGNASYADLITQAIESVPEKRLTLMQIYDWMIQNVPYFQERADGANSMGWKNSVRHNLSLHDQFSRIQNEGTGKSSWWVVNKTMLRSRLPRTRRATMGDPILLDKKRIKVGKKLKNLEYTSTSTLNSEEKYEDGIGRGNSSSNNSSLNLASGSCQQNNQARLKSEAIQSLSDQNVGFVEENKKSELMPGLLIKKHRTNSEASDTNVELNSDGSVQPANNPRRSSFTVSSSNNEFESDEMVQQQQLRKAQLINALLNRHRMKSSLLAQQKQHQLQQQQQQLHHQHQNIPANLSYVVCTSMPLTIQQGQLCLAMGSFNSNNNNCNVVQHNSHLQIQPQFQPSQLQLQHQQIQFQTQPLQLQAQPVHQIQLQLQPQQIHIHPQQLQIQPQQVQFQSHQLLLQPQIQQQQQQVPNNIILKVQPSANPIQPVNVNNQNNGRPIVLYVTTSKNSILSNQNQTNQQFVLTRGDQDVQQPQMTLQQSSQNSLLHTCELEQQQQQQQRHRHTQQSTCSESQIINKYINTDLNKQAHNMTLTDEMSIKQEDGSNEDDDMFQELPREHQMQQQQQQQQHGSSSHETQAYISEKRQKMLLDLLHSEKFCEIRRKNPEFNNKIIEILKKKKEMLEASASQNQQHLHQDQEPQQHFNVDVELQQQQQYLCLERQQRHLDMVNDYISTLNSPRVTSERKVFTDENGKEQHQAISSSSIMSDDNNMMQSLQNDGEDEDGLIDDDEQVPTTTTTTTLDDEVVNRVIEDINFEESIDELFDVNSLLNCDDELSQAFPSL